MKKITCRVVLVIIFFSLTFGIDVYANTNNTGELRSTTSTYGDGAIGVHEDINRSSGKLLINEKFIRYIPKSNENTELEVKNLYISTSYKDTELVQGNGEDRTYIIEEDNRGYYIKSNITDYESVYHIGMDYYILNSMEEYNDSYYIKQELYDNKMNSMKIDSILLSTGDTKGNGEDNTFNGIWSKGGSIDLGNKDGSRIDFNYKLDDTDKVEIVRKYRKSAFSKVYVVKDENTITDKKLEEDNWFDAYSELDDYVTAREKKERKDTLGGIFRGIIMMGIFAAMVIYVPKILGGYNDDNKRNNSKCLKWPSFISPSYVAVATEQNESRVVLTMIFELINRNVLKIRRSEYFGYINNWNSYVMKLSSEYNKLPSYLENVVEKIKELSNERELTIVNLKELINDGYFESAYIECKNEYESMEQIEIEKWNKYKGKLIYSDEEDYKAMDNYTITLTHLYSVAMGMDINEILKYMVSEYNLESTYIATLLSKNEENESIADFFTKN